MQHGVQSRSVPEALLTYVGLRASVDDEVDESIEEVWSRAVVERPALALDRSELDITGLEPEPRALHERQHGTNRDRCRTFLERCNRSV